MNMIFSTRFNIMWNGTPLSPIITSRRVHQGDPLSPYLFIICLERLSIILKEAIQDRAIHPVTFRGQIKFLIFFLLMISFFSRKQK